MSSSSLSDRSATKIHSDRVGASLAFPSTSSSTTSSDEEGVVGSPSHSGYEWVDKGVREYFSKYQSSSSIRKFAAAYAILDEDSPDEAVSLDQVSRADNACDGRGGYSDEFFFMYSVLLTSLHVRLPFDEFTVGVLRILNVAPSQLQPNAWAALEAFKLVCRALGLKPSPPVFLHYYSTRPKELVGWLSLFGQPRIGLLAPYSSSFKSYKNTFFRVVVNPPGRPYFFDGDVPKFPFYWARNPLHYDKWLQTMLSAEDCEILNLLDSLPRRLPTKRIVAILNSPRPRGDMLGMCQLFLLYVIMLTYLTLRLLLPTLMASHEGVGARRKSRFQLLREKVNARKKDEDALVGSSSGAAGRNSVGGVLLDLHLLQKRRGRRLPRKVRARLDIPLLSVVEYQKSLLILV